MCHEYEVLTVSCLFFRCFYKICCCAVLTLLLWMCLAPLYVFCVYFHLFLFLDAVYIYLLVLYKVSVHFLLDFCKWKDYSEYGLYMAAYIVVAACFMCFWMKIYELSLHFHWKVQIIELMELMHSWRKQALVRDDKIYQNWVMRAKINQKFPNLPKFSQRCKSLTSRVQ